MTTRKDATGTTGKKGKKGRRGSLEGGAALKNKKNVLIDRPLKKLLDFLTSVGTVVPERDVFPSEELIPDPQLHGGSGSASGKFGASAKMRRPSYLETIKQTLAVAARSGADDYSDDDEELKEYIEDDERDSFVSSVFQNKNIGAC
jgi:hypothetical protein